MEKFSSLGLTQITKEADNQPSVRTVDVINSFRITLDSYGDVNASKTIVEGLKTLVELLLFDEE